MVKMGAREFVYPNFGYRSRWLRSRDPVYSVCIFTLLKVVSYYYLGTYVVSGPTQFDDFRNYF